MKPTYSSIISLGLAICLLLQFVACAEQPNAPSAADGTAAATSDSTDVIYTLQLIEDPDWSLLHNGQACNDSPSLGTMESILRKMDAGWSVTPGCTITLHAMELKGVLDEVAKPTFASATCSLSLKPCNEMVNSTIPTALRLPLFELFSDEGCVANGEFALSISGTIIAVVTDITGGKP